MSDKTYYKFVTCLLISMMIFFLGVGIIVEYSEYAELKTAMENGYVQEYDEEACKVLWTKKD